MNKERRIEIRIPLLSEFVTWTTDEGLRRDEMLNITKHGVFIKSIKQPALNELVNIYFTLPQDLGQYIVPGKVQWRQWASSKKKPKVIGFGVKFVFADAKMELIIKSYTEYLRNKQIIKVSKRLIEDFFNSRPDNIL